jgi:hypothetical protein
MRLVIFPLGVLLACLAPVYGKGGGKSTSSGKGKSGSSSSRQAIRCPFSRSTDYSSGSSKNNGGTSVTVISTGGTTICYNEKLFSPLHSGDAFLTLRSAIKLSAALRVLTVPVSLLALSLAGVRVPANLFISTDQLWTSCRFHIARLSHILRSDALQRKAETTREEENHFTEYFIRETGIPTTARPVGSLKYVFYALCIPSHLYHTL